MTQQAFTSHIPSQIHQSSVTLQRVALIFICTFFIFHIELRDVPHFDSLIFSNIFLCDLLFIFWLETLAFMFPAIY